MKHRSLHVQIAVIVTGMQHAQDEQIDRHADRRDGQHGGAMDGYGLTDALRCLVDDPCARATTARPFPIAASTSRRR